MGAAPGRPADINGATEPCRMKTTGQERAFGKSLWRGFASGAGPGAGESSSSCSSCCTCSRCCFSRRGRCSGWRKIARWVPIPPWSRSKGRSWRIVQPVPTASWLACSGPSRRKTPGGYAGNQQPRRLSGGVEPNLPGHHGASGRQPGHAGSRGGG